MIITADEVDGIFKAKVREGEVIHFRGQLDWDDKKAGLRLEYWLEGEKILCRRLEEKWWWKFVGAALENELKQFSKDGMKRATEIRNAKAKSAKMAAAAKILFKDQ